MSNHAGDYTTEETQNDKLQWLRKYWRFVPKTVKRHRKTHFHTPYNRDNWIHDDPKRK